MSEPNLAALFEDEEPLVEIVNISDHTPNGLTISQRIQVWCALSDRHVYIGRGSVWGNPYSHLAKSAAEFQVQTRKEAIEKYEEYLAGRPDLISKLEQLRGKVLGCWCVPKRCHGEVVRRFVLSRAAKI